MSTLVIRKKSLKTWLHTDSILGDFIISKFYFNADSLSFQIVEQGKSKRVIYNVSDITLFALPTGGSAETFANITDLSLRLEALNYPAFQYDGQITSIANLIDAGTNVTITGDGTEASPYVISSTGGGGSQTLQQTMQLGRTYTQTVGDYTYSLSFSSGSLVISVTNNVTGDSFDISGNNDLLSNNVTNNDNYVGHEIDASNGYRIITDVDYNDTSKANELLIPLKTSETGITRFELQNNLPAGTYKLATLESPTFTGVVTTPEIILTSTTKGFKPNALTTTQRNAIGSPTAGLMIFNTTEGYPEYFDSFWGWMPLYTSNEWKAKNGVEYFNEISTTLGGDGMLVAGTASSGSVSYASSSISNRLGLGVLSTSTNATGRAWFGQGIGTTASIMRMGGGRIILETSVRIPTLSDGTQRFQFLSGLSSTNNSTSIGNGILFAYDEGGVSSGSSASANWQVATMLGGARTWTTTSVPVVANQFYKLTIEINDACTSVVFKIDGTIVRTETLTLPSSTDIGLMTQIYKSIGTTARTVEVDYISFKQKFTTAR
jgi:hypothetical protein